ncbi:D-alanine--D-alanine ligase [compost metagenome]
MDKHLSKTVLRSRGVLTPDWLSWDSMAEYDPQAVERLGYPVMVKPNSGGSSIGMSKVNETQELKAAVEKAFAEGCSILIEKFTTGQEITCPILGGEMLPVIGIEALGGEWFDYSSKYEQGGAEERVIQLPYGTHERVHTAARACYKALKCSVYARVDMLLVAGVPYVLEVNTLPGMTETSLLPQSALATGYSFSGLLDAIIERSLQERRGASADRKQSAEAGQGAQVQAVPGEYAAHQAAASPAEAVTEEREVAGHA